MPFIPAHWDVPDPRMRFDHPDLRWDLGLWVEDQIMPDAIIKIDVDKLPDADVVSLAKKHKKGLEDNPTVFPEGAGYIADLGPMITAAEGKLAEIVTHDQNRKTLTQQKNQAVTVLKKQVKKGGKMVDLKAGGNPVIMTQGGFGPRDTASPPQIVAPTGLSATYGDAAGSISLHWNPPPGAVSFVAQYRVANQNGAWQNSAPVTPSTMQLTGLTPGELYEVRVCATFAGQAQPGPACDTIEHRAA